jgi:hypothetical protein
MRTLKTSLFVGLFLCAHATHAVTDIDIRVTDTAAIGGAGSVEYAASFTDCLNLTTIDVGSSGSLTPVDLADLQFYNQSRNSCFVTFSLDSASRLEPAVEISLSNGELQSHAESFSDENFSPELNFDTVEIVGTEGDQSLVVSVDAVEDTDIAYLSFNIIGLSASDLRASGGVIAEAKNRAFLNTQTAVRVYPSTDDQTKFSYSGQLRRNLSAEEIAFDAIILADITIIDSSGNHSSLSKVAFTGDSIQEEARALIVSETPIVINNSLQTPVIIPAVDFQFRGVVNLGGLGNNITYSSSHPDLIGVTQGGVIFALQETNGVGVTITVSFPGLADAFIPVEADFSKELVGISLAGVDASTPFLLPSLNTYYPLPEIQGVFDDGSRTLIAGHWTPRLTISSAASTFLQQNSRQELRASVSIPETAPAQVSLAVVELAGVESTIPVIAEDGQPEVSLSLPSSVVSQTELTVTATASDDVGINQVQILLDGAVVGTLINEPFELVMPIAEQLEGRTLVFTALATDTAGQTTLSNEHSVQVSTAPVNRVPDYEFALPVDAQRVVESSPIKIQVESLLGIIPDVAGSSGIEKVDFFFDGAQVGTATFPGIELREISGTKEQQMFEIWSIEVNAPSISTTQTSLSVGARISSRTGSEDAPAKLIRIIENGPPQVSIVAPQKGSQATAGQDLVVQVEVVDETLSLGTKVELLIDSAVVETIQYSDSTAVVNALNTESTIVRFTRSITAEDIGSTFRLQARVTDFHQAVNVSSIVRLPIKSDQAPTVAISNPTAGASFVSGLPILIRANAVDDLGVSRVDFYVNAQLVGSDRVAPYAFVYDTQQNISVEQRLAIHVVAFDTKDQQATSNTVEVTLGQDEEPPVVNISSPLITGVDVGDDIAGIIEQTEFVIKASGFDEIESSFRKYTRADKG